MESSCFEAQHLKTGISFIVLRRKILEFAIKIIVRKSNVFLMHC